MEYDWTIRRGVRLMTDPLFRVHELVGSYCQLMTFCLPLHRKERGTASYIDCSECHQR